MIHPMAFLYNAFGLGTDGLVILVISMLILGYRRSEFAGSLRGFSKRPTAERMLVIMVLSLIFVILALLARSR